MSTVFPWQNLHKVGANPRWPFALCTRRLSRCVIRDALLVFGFGESEPLTSTFGVDMNRII
jgi:hypothetical protein